MLVLICEEFNGTIYFIKIRRSTMAAKQEVASITTYIYAGRVIFSLYRFEWVTSSMVPFFILWEFNMATKQEVP